MKSALGILPVACSLCALAVKAEETVTAQAEIGSLALDLRMADVRTSDAAAALPPIAYNNTADWRKGGDAAAALVSLSVSDMEATDPTDVSTWVPKGDPVNLEVVSPEGAVVWPDLTGSRPIRGLFRVSMASGSDPVQYAYLDLREAEDLPVDDIGNCSIELSDDTFIFDGTVKRPTVTVACGERTLAEGVDYKLVYLSDGIREGTVRVEILGLGDFGGRISREYAIIYDEVAAAARAVKVLDLREGVLDVPAHEWFAALAWNDDAAWPRGGQGDQEAHVTVSPMADAESEPDREHPRISRIVTGEGTLSLKGLVRGFYEARMEFLPSGPVLSRIIEIECDPRGLAIIVR